MDSMTFQFHEHSNIFPMMSSEDLDRLADDIRTHGLRERITLLDDKILDGRNRYVACLRAGVEPRFGNFQGDDPLAFVVSENVHRRHLNESQRAMIASRLAQMPRGRQPKSNGQICLFTQESAAEALNVGARSVKSARVVQERGVALLVQLVDAGRLAVSEALKAVKEDHKTQRLFVQKIKEGLNPKTALGEAIRESPVLASRIHLPNTIKIIHGDFRDKMKMIESESVDLIFTDPVYDRASIPLYGDLARESARALKSGGSLLVYAGQHSIASVINLMSEHLRYWWLLAIRLSGGHGRLKGIFVEWKPLLWFVKNTRASTCEYVTDFLQSKPPSKRQHLWQQSETEAMYYISHLSKPGDTVLDPFAGTGTTLIVAHRLGRNAIGIEIDAETVKIARNHIQSAIRSTREESD
jgi:16S rRNA G966 N2-methylase RsmD